LMNMLPSEGVVAAEKGDVAGLLSFEPFLYRLTALGGTKYVTGRQSWITGQQQDLAASDRFLFLNAILMAQDSWIKEKPNTVKAVMRAFDRATKFLATDRQKAVEIVGQGIKIDPAAIAAIMNVNQYNSSITPDIASSITDLSEWALSIKRIPVAVKPTDIIDTTLLDAANPSLVTWHPQ
jgi:ABC-type nitrate/sulfonate/bicarbonate transport system substrate-binding protein